MISYIITAIIFFFVGAEFAFKFYYSPKAQIKHLWKSIIKMTKYISEEKERLPEFKDQVHFLEPEIEKNKKIIKSLLDYYFDPQNPEDAEFIRKNKP